MARIKWLLFLLSISQIWLAQPGPMRTQEFRAPKQADWLKRTTRVLIGPGWASQIWEMLKRKNSHLILVTLDNTSDWVPLWSVSNLKWVTLVPLLSARFWSMFGRAIPPRSSFYVISFEFKSGSSYYLAYLTALHLTRNWNTGINVIK